MPPVDDPLRSPSPQPSRAPSASGSPFPYGAPAGWRPDPARPGTERWWDGRHWSDRVRATGSPEVATRAAARAVAASQVRPESDRAHRLGAATRASLAVLAVSLLGAVYLELSAWRGRRPGGVAASDLVDTVLGGVTGLTLVGVGVVVLGVVALVTYTLVGEWAAAVLHHELTDAAMLAQPLFLVVMALGPGLLVPVLGPWSAARGLARLWHATRAPQLTLGTGLPAVVTAWLVTTLTAQLVPPLVVATALTSGRVAGDVVGAVTLAGVLLTVCALAATVLLAEVVRQCDRHLSGRLRAGR